MIREMDRDRQNKQLLLISRESQLIHTRTTNLTISTWTFVLLILINILQSEIGLILIYSNFIDNWSTYTSNIRSNGKLFKKKKSYPTDVNVHRMSHTSHESNQNRLQSVGQCLILNRKC